jgi:hypothetical protein
MNGKIMVNNSKNILLWSFKLINYLYSLLLFVNMQLILIKNFFC